MRRFLVTLSTAEQERMNNDLKSWHTGPTGGPVFMAEDAPGLTCTAEIELEYDGIMQDEIERRFQVADPGCKIHRIQEITEL